MDTNNSLQAISAAVNAFCKDSKYLLISIDMRMNFYSSEENFYDSSLVHFLFFRKWAGGPCHTFCAKGENIYEPGVAHRNFWYQMNSEDWEKISEHDSCWRNAMEREVDNEYFRMARNIIQNIEDCNVGEERETLSGDKVTCKVRPCDINLTMLINTMEIVDVEATMSLGKTPVSIININK